MNQSLAAILDTVNESVFYGIKIPQKTGKTMVQTIMGRQGKPGAYEGTYAPFNMGEVRRFRLFTGEAPSPRSARHIMGQESVRSLILLDGKSRTVRENIRQATKALDSKITEAFKRKYRHPAAFFCCPKCTCGMWRNLAVGGLPRAGERLYKGLKALRHYRDAKHGWRSFPFYYLTLTLLDINMPLARQELKHTAGLYEKALAGKFLANNRYSRRRRDVLEKALAAVN